MNDYTQPQQPTELLHKSDVPAYNSGLVIKVMSFTLPLAFLAAAYLDPELHETRPGIIDGTLGLIIGIITGGLARASIIAKQKRELISRKRGDKLWWLHGIHREDLPGLAYFALTGILSTIIGYVSHMLRFDWPLVGKNPTFMAGIWGYCGSIMYVCAKWYDSLPD